MEDELKNFKMEDDLKNFKMEDDLKKIKMEDYLKNLKMDLKKFKLEISGQNFSTLIFLIIFLFLHQKNSCTNLVSPKKKSDKISTPNFFDPKKEIIVFEQEQFQFQSKFNQQQNQIISTKMNLTNNKINSKPNLPNNKINSKSKL